MRIVIILLGCPGAGKGTQGKLLQQCLSIPLISTGDMLRGAIGRGTRLGAEVKMQMDAGGLVSDEIVDRVVAQRILRRDCDRGFILDGYPRTVAQARALETLLNDRDHLTAIEIDIAGDELVDRLVARRCCSGCGAIYNLLTATPLVRDACDGCGAPLIQRSDDCEDVVRARLRTYHNQSIPLARHFARLGVYHRVPGMLSVSHVFERVDALVTHHALAAVRREAKLALQIRL